MIQDNSSNKPDLTLRISITDRCQLRCAYCMPPDGIKCFAREEIISFEDIIDIVKILQSAYELQKVRLTGGEPLLRKNITELVAMLKKIDIPDLALTTNGLLLPQLAQNLKAAGLDRLNISLDSLNAERYREITRGGDVEKTLRGIECAVEAGFSPVKINSVINADSDQNEILALLEYSLAHGCEQRFLELMPIGYGNRNHASGFVANADVRQWIGTRYELIPLGREPGSSSVRYEVKDAGIPRGTVGFISPCSGPFCADCHRLRLTTNGSLIGCLALDRGIDARHQIANPSEFLKLTAAALGKKRKTTDCFNQPLNMAAIGG